MKKMPILEDSGIDSEDKQSTIFDEPQKLPKKPNSAAATTAFVSPVRHMADLEVVFRGAATGTGGNIDDVYKAHENKAGKIATTTTGDSDDSNEISSQLPPNTCRILQRKLELKVERAKRNYSQYQQENARKTQSAHLIPISRLPIPGEPEQKPLVDYKSDSSDEPEEISFFPAKLKNARRQHKPELSDTFSIQEMTIDSDLDSDDSGSGNLELLPPLTKSNFLDKLRGCFKCCAHAS